MTAFAQKNEIIEKLRADMLSMQGFRPVQQGYQGLGLGAIEGAFPQGVFPVGAVHEFVSQRADAHAAATGFISVLAGKLMAKGGVCLWIGQDLPVYPPALKSFGIDPHRVIFVQPAKQEDKLWVMEEALKCESLAAVVAEIPEVSFTQSRRLQLAVEKSHVTGLLHRYNPRQVNTLACVSRWEISSIPGSLPNGMPGVGFPSWNIRLSKARNGEPGEWQMEWVGGKLRNISRIKEVQKPKRLETAWELAEEQVLAS